MINKLFSAFIKKEKPKQIQYQTELAPWNESDSQNLFNFLKTDTGDLFLKKLKAHHLEVTQWATDVGMENYDNMKYRACVAYGAKLGIDFVLSLCKVAPKLKHQTPDKEQMDKFFTKRMAMFKG